MPLDPFFSGSGLDRADLLRADEATLADLAARSDARELLWNGALPRLDDHGRLGWGPIQSPELFLGLAPDGSPRFSAVGSGAFDYRAQFGALSILDRAEAATCAAALSLAQWHRRHRFCANCGQPSRLVRGGWSRRCQACSAEHFPRVDPVVIMLAEHDGRLLLGRQPQYPPGRYSALAGFVEVGENIEAAVAREFHEEAGITVRDVRYLASQPWPFPSSLMIGCWAEAIDDRLTIDTTELDDARWFSREEVASALAGEPDAAFLPPPPFAIARTLLEWWLDA
ncbi:NAD(+) diphosphatase [Sphingomonas arenae]|uniref:NAD(+) diphosphatase n=1 Tax=Sphingomonas arenae TaxID=2812555 RepID=UPI001F02A16E|nr:NAD(+) diphosphatase [Sphingomonas arenae]